MTVSRGTVEIRHLIRFREDQQQVADRMLFTSVLGANLDTLSYALMPALLPSEGEP